MRRSVVVAEVAMVVLLSLLSFIANLVIDAHFPECSDVKPAIALSSAFFCLIGVVTFLALESLRKDAVKYTRAYMVLQGLKFILSLLVVIVYGFFNREQLLPFLVIFGVFFMIYLVFEAIALTKLK
ncbi:MAG: hypothetical protein IKX43_06345 [Paludibacteraceae bacterium]|nr:hypothetical protein [Paludibacteraceae bacterium]